MLELFNEYRVIAQHLTALLLAVAVWRWGGGPERWLMGIFVAIMVIPFYAIRLLDPADINAAPFSAAYVTLDLVAAALFVTIALNANRNYPLWIAAFQLVAVASHGVGTLVDSVSPLAYAILVIGPSYCQLAILLGGFIRHYVRLRRYGAYREWRTAPPLSGWVTQ